MSVTPITRRPLTSVVVDPDGSAYICILLRDDVTLGRLAQVLAAGGLVISNSNVTDALIIHPKPKAPI